MDAKTIVISNEQFNQILDKINQLEKKIDTILNKQKHTEDWLTIEETCNILKISRRTLQNYRDKNLIPFSQVGNKIYFKASDVYNFLEQNYRRAR